MSYKHPCRGDGSQPSTVGAYGGEVGQPFGISQFLTGDLFARIVMSYVRALLKNRYILYMSYTEKCCYHESRYFLNGFKLWIFTNKMFWRRILQNLKVFPGELDWFFFSQYFIVYEKQCLNNAFTTTSYHIVLIISAYWKYYTFRVGKLTHLSCFVIQCYNHRSSFKLKVVSLLFML